MNTKKAATNKNGFSFEEKAHERSLDFIFCGIHTLKFIGHSIRTERDLTPLFPAEGMEAEVPRQIKVQLAGGGPEVGL